jgi:outer membrane protein with beta-barrel domain
MRVFPKLCLFLFIASVGAFAQLPFSVGVKVGVPLTDAFNKTTFGPDFTEYSDSKNYIVGPMVELKLPFHLSVEADALYRPLNLTASSPAGKTSSDYSSWEFPILAKFHFSFPIVKPYFEAGPSFRATSDKIGHLSNNGITVGVGADVKAILIRVSPEFRYTHWASDSFPDVIPLALPTTYIASKQDQVEFLVGLSF